MTNESLVHSKSIERQQRMFETMKPTIELDQLSQQHDFQMFLKKQKIITEEFAKFSKAHKVGCKKICDALTKNQKEILEELVRCERPDNKKLNMNQEWNQIEDQDEL